MNNKSDRDVPFYVDDSGRDTEEVFSSVPAADEEEVFSSVSSSAIDTFTSAHPGSISGGYQAITSAQAAQAAQPPPTPQQAFTSAPPAPSFGSGPAVSMGQDPWLEVLDANGQATQKIEVPEGRTILGTSEGADGRLTDRFASPWHAVLQRRGQELIIEDLGSSNGVYLGIADEFTLEDGDELIVGSQRFIFHTHTPAPTLPRLEHQPQPAQGAPAPANFPHLIRVLEGGQIGGLYPLGESFTIGRSNTAASYPGDPLLDDHHATLQRRQNQYVLFDMQSRYGTYIRVGGVVELYPDDCFVIGQTRIRLHA